MIISHPVLNRFSPSIKEIVPENGDDTLHISPLLSLVGLPPEPTALTTILGITQESSSLAHSNLQVANAGSQSSNIMFLRSGWWKLQFHVTYQSNFLAETLNGEAQIILDNGSITRNIMAIHSVIGVQNFTFEREFLLRDGLTGPAFSQAVQMNLAANTVGQSHQLSVSLSALKLL